MANARVQGDVCEFGSRGYNVRTLCNFLARFEEWRTLHFFDTFEGYPEPRKDDLGQQEIIEGSWGADGGSVISRKQLRTQSERLYPKHLVKIYKGLFSDTLTELKDRKIALALLDACQYTSTSEVLTHLFSKSLLSEGAMLQFADWSTSRASPNQGSRRAWSETISKFNVSFSDAGTFNWGGRKFIVHAYDRQA